MLLLDDEFIKAYRNGIVVRCYNGVLRQIYPQIFTYSADYPEKWAYTHLRPLWTKFAQQNSSRDYSWQQIIPLSLMLCSEGAVWPPWICLGYLITALSGTQLPTKQDMFCKTRNLPVWEGHQECDRRTNSERTLLGTYIGELSALIHPHLALNNSKNTFAERLSPFGFDIFSSLVIDLMHEFELGILKSILKHLIQILYALDPGLIIVLNER